MAKLRGNQVEVYVGGDRSTGTRITVLTDTPVDIPDGSSEEDNTTQADVESGYRSTEAGLASGTATFTVAIDPADAGYQALVTAKGQASSEFAVYTHADATTPYVYWNSRITMGFSANPTSAGNQTQAVTVRRQSDVAAGS